MKTIIGIAIAGALSVGAANAAIVPPQGNGELIELVVDTSTHQVYARGLGSADLEQAILPASSILSQPTYDALPPTSLPVDTGHPLPIPSVNPDANLTTFLAQNGGHDSFQFAIIGGGTGTAGATGNNPGAKVGAFTSTQTLAAGSLAVPLSSAINGLNANLLADVTTLNGAIGGTAGDGTSANVSAYFTDASPIFSYYGANIPLLQDLGKSVNLYAMTGDKSTVATAQLYTAGLISMDATGKLSVSSVPLPAAVWLFGSGILGLAGIGRRRKTEVVELSA